MNRSIYMKKILVVSLVFSLYKLYALSSDDFIIQESDVSKRYRVKVYLGQNWDEVNITDKLIRQEVYENWSGYKNVIIYYYENIEIVTAQQMPNSPYRSIVDITVTGKKFSTMSEITIGSHVEDMIRTYGEPKSTFPSDLSEDKEVFVYEIFDPHSAWNDITLIKMSIVHDGTIISKIIVYYVYNI
jgi:hypothetical protein